MKLSRSIVEKMPTDTIAQARRRKAAQKELARAERVVSQVEDRFEAVMRTDNGYRDQNDKAGKVVSVDGSYQAIASQSEGRREFSERRITGSASYVRHNAFSTTYGSTTQTTESNIVDRGDKTCFSQKVSYGSHYPTDNVTVVRDESGDEAQYQIYDSWLFGKLAQAGVIG